MASSTTTTTVTNGQFQPTLSLRGELASDNSDVPKTLSHDFLSSIPKLNDQQAGHIRHFHNLANQLDGEWDHMGAQEPMQEWLDAYRYQIATMAYASGAAHYHRLPALRSVFQPLLKQLIHKMLRKEVWAYWYLTSQGGKLTNPAIKELRKPWADPNKKENIMYSGHLLLMVSLYSMLFNDDEFDKDGALTFYWDPIFWGMGPETFKYTRSSLQQTIIDEMEREKWLGVCCEPNVVFVVCNQFPLIAMRYNDIRKGTNTVDEVLEKYRAAWKAKGMIGPNGLLVDMYQVQQDTAIPARDISFTAWANAFMNSWNPNQVQSTYSSQILGFITRVSSDRVNVNSPVLAKFIRDDVTSTGADPHDPETIKRARHALSELPKGPPPPFIYKKPQFGYIAQWVSEVGDSETLKGLLNHADHFMGPKWERGGLYYPRYDPDTDTDGNWKKVDPFTGNAAIGYARLNVPNGQNIMYNSPWTKEDAENRPFVDGVGLNENVDFLRGGWVEEKKAIVVTVRTWDGGEVRIKPAFCNLLSGRYAVYINGELSFVKEVEKKGGKIEVEAVAGAKEVDIVVIQA